MQIVETIRNALIMLPVFRRFAPGDSDLGHLV
jgi:hypothetical protein